MAFKNYMNKTERKLTFYRPFACYRVTSGYGWRTLWNKRSWHRGVDLVPTIINRDIVSIGKGVVIRIMPKSMGNAGGNIVVVQSTWYPDAEVKYMHLKDIKVQVGDSMGCQTQIGTMGSTGHSTGPHLHMEIWYNGKPLNPLGRKVRWLQRKISYSNC